MKSKKTKEFDIDEDWLREQYLTCKRTMKDIAADLGCARTTIRKRLKEFGIPIRKKKVEISGVELKKMYDSGMRGYQLAKFFGCSHSVMWKKLAQHGVVIPDKNRKPRTDLTGKRFGYLIVTEFGGTDEIGEFKWKCLCDCGKSCTMKGTGFTRRESHCGCKSRRSFGRVLSGEGFVCDRMLSKIKNSCVRQKGCRLLKFDITREELESLPHEKCPYCGDKLTFPKNSKEINSGSFTASLDRIDSTIDCYDKTNAQWVCKTCNLMKMAHSEDFFLNHIQKMARTLKAKEDEEAKDMMSGL